MNVFLGVAFNLGLTSIALFFGKQVIKEIGDTSLKLAVGVAIVGASYIAVKKV